MNDKDNLDYLLSESDMNDNEEMEQLKSLLGEMGIDFNQLEQEFDNYTTKKSLPYQVISPDAVEPEYVYPTDSGFDLYSTIEVVIPAFNRALIPTGLKFDIPDGTEIQIRPKSGLALNHGLTVLNTPGTADCGYTGEIKVIIFNTNPFEYKIEKGMKIAQAVLCPVVNGKWVNLNRVETINEKDRGEKGFGSTGI